MCAVVPNKPPLTLAACVLALALGACEAATGAASGTSGADVAEPSSEGQATAGGAGGADALGGEGLWTVDAGGAEEPGEGPAANADPAPPEACAPVGGLLEGDPLVIPTTEGPAVGVLREGTRSWRGLPYAAAPVGALRFRPPVSPPCREVPLVAAEFGPVCPQPLDYSGEVVGDEDCLTLDIQAPMQVDCEGGGCPVLVFLHGGGHVAGGAGGSAPGGGRAVDGARIAAEDGVIVVTLQSRLGALGWLAHEALAAEQPEGPVGNYGLLDQQRALAWLRDNIRAFGGDPGRVTLAGTSTGAVQTALHLAAPASAGLFSRAVVMSGAARARRLEAALLDGARRVARTRCAPERGETLLACLRALPVQELVTATHAPPTLASTALDEGGALGPTVDGFLLPGLPLELIANRHATKGTTPPALLVGSNAEELEGLLTAPGLTPERWEDTVRELIAGPLGSGAGLAPQQVLEALLAAYPLEAYASPEAALAAMFTDLRFTCPARRLLKAAEGPEARAWRYLFARRAVTATGELPASHGRELGYFFGATASVEGAALSEVDAVLSDTMRRALVAFARDGRPAVDGLVWAPYRDRGATLVFEARPRLSEDPGHARCELWERLASAADPVD
jgi:para-nitrobenzyl esterase